MDPSAQNDGHILGWEFVVYVDTAVLLPPNKQRTTSQYNHNNNYMSIYSNWITQLKIWSALRVVKDNDNTIQTQLTYTYYIKLQY